jgi:hypothetical protein
MQMAFAGHQFPRALADALGKPAADEAPMVQEGLSVICVQKVPLRKVNKINEIVPRVEVISLI